MNSENNRITLIRIIGLTLSILFFCIAMYMNICSGYARDAGYYVPSFFGDGLWVLLIGSIFSTIILLILGRVKNKTISGVVSIIVCIALLVYGLTITIGWFYSYDELKNGIRSPNMTSITLEELEKAIDSKDASVIYIGRQSCPVCEYIMPYFIHYLETSNIDVSYYNTSRDRDFRPEKMNEILDSINVEYIPITLCLDEGMIVKAFSGQNMVTNMKEYFETKEGVLFLDKLDSR